MYSRLRRGHCVTSAFFGDIRRVLGTFDGVHEDFVEHLGRAAAGNEQKILPHGGIYLLKVGHVVRGDKHALYPGVPRRG